MPGKKKRAIPKSGPVWQRSAVEATLDQMPKYNAHACATGAHGDRKYNRAKQKRNWQHEMNREGACDRGRLRLVCENRLFFQLHVAHGNLHRIMPGISWKTRLSHHSRRKNVAPTSKERETCRL